MPGGERQAHDPESCEALVVAVGQHRVAHYGRDSFLWGVLFRHAPIVVPGAASPHEACASNASGDVFAAAHALV
jgi:hypothetical protein